MLRRYNAKAAEALIRRHQQDSEAASSAAKPVRAAVPPIRGIIARRSTADAQTEAFNELEGGNADNSFHTHILEQVRATVNETIREAEAVPQQDASARYGPAFVRYLTARPPRVRACQAGGPLWLHGCQNTYLQSLANLQFGPLENVSSQPYLPEILCCFLGGRVREGSDLPVRLRHDASVRVQRLGRQKPDLGSTRHSEPLWRP